MIRVEEIGHVLLKPFGRGEDNAAEPESAGCVHVLRCVIDEERFLSLHLETLQGRTKALGSGFTVPSSPEQNTTWKRSRIFQLSSQRVKPGGEFESTASLYRP